MFQCRHQSKVNLILDRMGLKNLLLHPNRKHPTFVKQKHLPKLEQGTETQSHTHDIVLPQTTHMVHHLTASQQSSLCIISSSAQVI